ncbi:MAG: hypothetical protein AVDCRST_MAG89-2232, partial [uncultured Gemmatimonadetes bacterium]
GNPGLRALRAHEHRLRIPPPAGLHAQPLPPPAVERALLRGAGAEQRPAGGGQARGAGDGPLRLAHPPRAGRDRAPPVRLRVGHPM